MAMRPGVQKRGSHGLFNEKDEPIILDRVANEIANHKGNVWSHVVSLRREDAIRLLGKLSAYYSSDAWKRDYAADEAGLLPKDLKRGVLSEDGIYNLLEE